MHKFFNSNLIPLPPERVTNGTTFLKLILLHSLHPLWMDGDIPVDKTREMNC